ncbi:MAG: tryptophan synthase subunit alpha [Mariprofundaceae bacterium]
MNPDRLKRVFSECKQQKRAALVGYLTAGDPDVDTSAALLDILAGQVDILEIGMPFSDPMADGPVIQLASERALAAGCRIEDVFNLTQKVRDSHPNLGIVLMGYANVPYAMGFASFSERAVAAGVDGVLLVDIPAEENAVCADTFRESGLHRIMLLSPTSSVERIKLAVECASGFIYYVSLTGITGADMGEAEGVQQQVETIRAHTDLPICVGFGVKSEAQAKEVATFADGVVVGSHFVRQIADHEGDRDAILCNMLQSSSLMRRAVERSGSCG